MAEQADRLLELAMAVSDGAAIDWNERQSAASSDHERQLVRALGLAHRISEVHACASWIDEQPQAPDAARDSTSATPGPRIAPACWGPLMLRERIGRGTFGDVYRAWDTRLDREVALKLLDPRAESNGAGQESRESTVIGEARLMALVRHPGVATVYGAERVEGRAGFWMELVHGQTLEQETVARGPLPPEEVARIGIAVGEALDAVHRAGLVHRDVKAQNVMRDRDGRIVLMDFGTGLELGQQGLTDDGARLAGTPLYLAPEVIEGGPPTVRSDVYSLGVLLYHLATGSFPVSGLTLREVRQAHARHAHVPLRTARPDLPLPLLDAVTRALAKSPTERFGSARDLAQALRGCFPEQARSRDAAGWVPVGLLALATLMAVGWLWTARSAETAVSFRARDWVLITEPDNRTGEPFWDATIEELLRLDLSSSPFVNIVPRERVEDALRLMKRPIDTRVDQAVGQEIGVRDGDIQALLTSRVEKHDAGYVLSVSLVSPSGTVASTISERVDQRAGFLTAVQLLSLRVRELLGEPRRSVRASRAGLAKVTTPSLEALHLYSQADRLVRKEGLASERVEALLTQAVTLDADFASAHMLLAQVGAARKRPVAEVLEHATRALAASLALPEMERLRIRIRRNGVLGRLAEDPAVREQRLQDQLTDLERVLQLRPDDFDALQAAFSLHEALGHQQAVELVTRLADSRPHALEWQVAAARTALRAGMADEARGHARRAQRLMPEALDSDNAFWPAWIELFGAHDAWLRNDAAGALSAADQLAARLGGIPEDARWQYVGQLAHFYIGVGRLQQAEQVARWFQDPRMADRLARSLACAERGDRAKLRRFLVDRFPTVDDARWVSLLLVDAGLLDTARRVAADIDQSVSDRGGLAFLEGQLALTEGRGEAAAELLQRARLLFKEGNLPWFRATNWLADALASRGATIEAIEVLEDASRLRHRAATGWSAGSGWTHARARLAILYRQAGRTVEAEAVESELRQVLEFADADHAVKRWLDGRASTPY
jgi:serine/threonine-protein kinase